MRLAPTARLWAWRSEPLKTWNKDNPRGFELFYRNVRVARVLPLRAGFTEFDGRWYWIAEYSGDPGVPAIPRKKTVHDPVHDPKKAKDDCEAYVRQCLGKPKHGPRRRLSWVKEVPDPNRSTAMGPPPGGKFLLNEKVVVGEVKPFRVGFGRYQGWYWLAFPNNLPEEFSHLTVTAYSSKSFPLDRLSDAKAECDFYLRKQLLISPLKKRAQ
jgi:hypothetical protein